MKLKVSIAVEEKGRNAPQYSLASDLEGEQTLKEFLQYIKNHLIIVAGETLQDEQSRGFDKDPVITVDGRIGKPVADVSPVGKIEFTAKAELPVVLAELYQLILDRSPVDTGFYKENHLVFYNRKVVAVNLSELSQWARSVEVKDGDVIQFINVVPYAGRLERNGNRAGGKKMRYGKSRDKQRRAANSLGEVRMPNGAYFLAYRAFARKYKRNTPVFFGWTPGSWFGTENLPSSNPHTGKPMRKEFLNTIRGDNGKVKKGGQYVYPTIKIIIREGGLL